ncbi:MAG TPA: TonB-dependent receptor [Kofleriaceae bacterium]|nr:TonB-dependent receptor [Kofleriaceae bacterium]
MAGLAKYLIAATLVASSWGARALAQGDAPPADAPPPAGSDAPPAGLSDADLMKLSQGEAIEIYDERPDKPFDRDTEVRLTGEELAAKGAVDLKSALALIPDVTVRESGRGGFQIDVRGARKGEVAIWIDGVLVSDPWYGTFDITSIPITDIVQIRVATTPQSPIDGPGGPGGVIEVHTRDAIGPQLVIARATADSLPTFGVSATARAALAKAWALRVSAAGSGGAHQLDTLKGTLDDNRHDANGSMRLEYRDGDRRVAIDGFVDDRHYVSPPSDVVDTAILLIDRETAARASIKADDKRGKLQLQALASIDYLGRTSRKFTDLNLVDQNTVEDISALRTGAMALATAPFHRDFRWVGSVHLEHESATVDTKSVTADAIGKGDVTVIEAAGDVQYERKRFRADASAGAAVPFGVDAKPWPEAKLAARYRVHQALELVATGGRKGRVPSLRERFDPMNGNPKLGPEISNYAELRAIHDVAKHAHIEVAPYYRHTTGTIRATVNGTQTTLYNTGDLDVTGVDVLVRTDPMPHVGVDAAYSYIHASGSTAEPLDFLPHHRYEATLRGGYAEFSGYARFRTITQFIDGGVTVPGYTLVEAALTDQLSRRYIAVLRGDDLLDARPLVRASYHGTGRTISLILQGTWD